MLNPLQNKNIKEKQKNTCLKKYGTTSILNDKEIRCSSKISNKFKREKIFNDNILNNKEYSPLFNKELYIKNGNNYLYEWKCKRCGYIFKSIYDDGLIKKQCPKCFSRFK